MPPARRRHQDLVLCACQSHCTVLNTETGLYEGNGQMIPPSTRSNHRRDDKRKIIWTTPPLAPPPPQIYPLPDIWDAEVEFLSQYPLTSRRGLEFVHVPSLLFNFSQAVSERAWGMNTGTYSLTNSRANYLLLYVETRLQELQYEISASAQSTDQVGEIFDKINRMLDRIMEEKAYYWNLRLPSLPSDRPLIVNTSIHFFSSGPSDSTLQAVHLSTLVLEHFFFTPRRALRTHLASLKGLLRGKVNDSILQHIPDDPRTCAVHYRLNPIIDSYISCPSCFCLYTYGPDVSNSTLPNCTHRKTPGSTPCSSPLWKELNISGRHSHTIPIAQYYHQDLKSWVGKLLSRPGIEALLLQHTPPVRDRVSDIWQSKAFAELRDSSNNPFLPGPSDEGRLIFGLAVDSFNPFWNKTAKQSVSSTCIWLVLLNLPPHLRYLPENIFLAGVIPGPSKPSTDEINHTIQLVVDVLLEFWKPGVFFSRTYAHPAGWLYLAMLVPFIADMLAARQVIGLPGTTLAHYCCTFCDIDIHDIDIFEPHLWPEKDVGHIRNIALKYKNAANEQEQKDLFNAYGIRWTPLLDLPYWDPIRFTVIDSMHCLDLGLIQNHCRNIFQIDNASDGGMGRIPATSGKSKLATSQKDLRAVATCLDAIRQNQSGLQDRLVSFDRKVLYTICVDYLIGVENEQTLVLGSKQALANRIFRWRVQIQGVNPAQLLVPLTRDPLRDTTPSDGVSVFPESISSSTTISTASTSSARSGVTRNSTGRRIGPGTGIELALAARVSRYLLKKEDRQKSLSQSTTELLLYLCDLLHVDYSGIDLSKRKIRKKLFDLLVDKSPAAVQQLVALAGTTQREKRPLLGQDVMEAIRGDMKNTQTPTWIDPAPPDWGTARRGKLSADHWRIIGTIHLPITLIRLWRTADPRHKFIEHYMNLVNAVRLANLKVTTPAQIGAYRAYILSYLRQLRVLYPDVNVRPTHHAAYHIYDMLKEFGPVHSHSAPFFERYNNFLQRMNTNRKIGQMESTFMHTSARHSNLKAMLHDSGPIRDSVVEMVTSLDQIQSEDSRGWRLASMLDPTLPTNVLFTRPGQHCLLSEREYNLLCSLVSAEMTGAETGQFPHECKSLSKLSVNSICYGVAESNSYRDSSVIFRSRQLDVNTVSTELAGSIRRLFQYSYVVGGREKQGYFASIIDYQRIAETRGADADPYPAFGYAAGYLCEKSDGHLHVVELSQLLSHFVLTRFPGGEWADFIHVLPVDRLMLSFRFEDQQTELEEPPE